MMTRTTEYDIQKQCVHNSPETDWTLVIEGQACSGAADAFTIAGVGTVPMASPGVFMLALAVIVAIVAIAYEAGRRREFEGSN